MSCRMKGNTPITIVTIMPLKLQYVIFFIKQICYVTSVYRSLHGPLKIGKHQVMVCVRVRFTGSDFSGYQQRTGYPVTNLAIITSFLTCFHSTMFSNAKGLCNA